MRLYSDDGGLLDTLVCPSVYLGYLDWTQVRLGGYGTEAAIDLYFDDVDIHSSAQWPGNVRWQYLEPTADDSCLAPPTNCAPSALYDCVDDIPPSDGTATMLSASTANCTFLHLGTGAKSITDPIHATLTWVNATGDSTASINRVLGNDAAVLGTLGAGFGDFFGLDKTDPSSGAGWTTTGVDSTSFGFKITGTGTASVSAVRWMVGYEVPTPTPTPPG